MRHNEHLWSCLAIGAHFIFKSNDGEDIKLAFTRARKIATRMQIRYNRYFRVAVVNGQVIVVGVAKGQHRANWQWHNAQIGQCFDAAILDAMSLRKVRETIRYWRINYNRMFVAEVCGPVICISRTG